jgi:multimeric flavodoxin WrbA
MNFNVVGIVGSYRKGGTIDSVVSEVLAGAREGGAQVEKIYLLDQRIEFCTNCRRCTQGEGNAPGACIHRDDMPGIIAAIERADALVLGAPVNFGNVNALTQRFIERLVSYAFWPWGQPAPKMRKTGKASKRAVLVTSSAMPAIMGRFATGSLKTLKKAAEVVGARPSDTIYVGLAAGTARSGSLRGGGRSSRRARPGGGWLSATPETRAGVTDQIRARRKGRQRRAIPNKENHPVFSS